MTPSWQNEPLFYILDEKGNPIEEPDSTKWGEWFEEHNKQRIVAQEQCGDYWVSTVFLAIDHRFTSEGEPILWETIAFGHAGSEQQRRYTSLTAARHGHTMICDWARTASRITRACLPYRACVK